MKWSENIILTDNSVEEMQQFKEGLEETSKIKFETHVMNANKGRTKKIDNIIRYIKYYIFPLKLFFNRKKVKRVVAWQQFYGLIYAFYCRLFKVKKCNYLYINVFIYREKKGLIGKIYYKFMKYIVTSDYIDKMSTTSKSECELYSKIFGVNVNKFVFTPFGVNSIEEKVRDIKCDENEKFILALGRSNRDWNFLIDTLKNSEYKLKIICDELKVKEKYKNIEIINNVCGQKSYEYIKKAFCVIIPIKNPEISAGQTVLLNSMQLKKPIIVTESRGLTDDYIVNGKTGFIIKKDKNELINVLKELYTSKELYNEIANNAYNIYKEKYSIKALGKIVGKIVGEKNESRYNN